jgi:hypothetical protein
MRVDANALETARLRSGSRHERLAERMSETLDVGAGPAEGPLGPVDVDDISGAAKPAIERALRGIQNQAGDQWVDWSVHRFYMTEGAERASGYVLFTDWHDESGSLRHFDGVGFATDGTKVWEDRDTQSF